MPNRTQREGEEEVVADIVQQITTAVASDWDQPKRLWPSLRPRPDFPQSSNSHGTGKGVGLYGGERVGHRGTKGAQLLPFEAVDAADSLCCGCC